MVRLLWWGDAGVLTWSRSDETDSASVVAALESQSEALRYALKTTVALFTLRIAEMGRSQNIYAMSHQLPPELLVKIFHFILEVGPVSDHFRGLHRLACVCHRWNDIIREAPSLWGYIATPFSPPLIKNAIARSKGAPLEVDLSVGGTYQAAFKQLAEAAKQAHRWRRVSLQIGDFHEHRSYLEVPAPLITHADIRSPTTSDIGTRSHSPPFVNLFQGQAHRLRDLRLCGISIPFHSPMLSELHHLELNSVTVGPSTSTLLQILSACPTLSSLILLSVHGDIDTPHNVLSPVVMSHLDDLALSKIETEYCATLLRGVRAPRCSRFRLQCKMPAGHQLNEEITFVENTLGQLIEPLREVLSAKGDLAFQISDSAIFFRQASKTLVSFNVRLENVKPMQILRWVIHTFSSEVAEIPMSLGLTSSQLLFDAEFLSVLENFDNIVEMRVAAVGGALGFNRLHQFLQQPYINSGVRRWRLPRLQTLSLLQSEDWGGLLSMVRGRHGTGEATLVEQVEDDHLQTELPLPFKKLAVEFPGTRLAGDLKAALGDTIVWLNEPFGAFYPGRQQSGASSQHHAFEGNSVFSLPDDTGLTFGSKGQQVSRLSMNAHGPP